MLSNLLSRRARKAMSSRRIADRRPLFLEQLEHRRVLVTNLDISPPNVSQFEGDAGNTAFTFTVTRSMDLTATSSVDFAVTGTGANAANAADFGGSLPIGTLSFAIGETSKVITVNVSGDTAVEPDEGFTVTLSNPTGATIVTGTATGTIRDDDNPASTTLTIAPENAVKFEGDSGPNIYTFTVTRAGALGGASSVNFAVTGSGANSASANDFTNAVLPSGTVNFAATETSKVIMVSVNGDTNVEPDEGFTVTLSNPTGAAIATATANGTIQDDDGDASTTLAIAATNAVQFEGNTGQTIYTFTVTRSGALSSPDSVNFAVTGSGANSATANDFLNSVLPSGTLNFAAGVTSQVIMVSVNGDTSAEPDEGFTVTLSNAVGATISTAAASGTILDDDGTTIHSIAATDASKPEGNSGTTPFTFTVTRSGLTSVASSVNFAVTGSGATPAGTDDFVGLAFPTGMVNFAVGETTKLITISVNADVSLEPNDGFTVTLSGASSGVISTASANGTIINDDFTVTTAIFIAATDANKAEGNSGNTAFTFTVSRNGDTTGTTSANFAVTGSGANPANAADFAGGILPTGSVSFAPGVTMQVVTINVAGDTLVELNENFVVTLSNAFGATITTPTATGTIQNDDTAALPVLAIAAADAAKAEGNSGNTAFTFTVTRTGDTTAASSASFAVTGSGANAAIASDFAGGILPTGTVNFAAGATSQVITVNVAGDTTVEPDEGFTVTLSSPSGATISTATATGTILNDDAVVLPSLAIAATSATQAEGNSGTTAFTFTVTRTGDTTAASSASFAVTGSGASPANATDFAGGILPTGTVSFAAGVTSQLVTVNVAGDTTVEPDEGFTVTLSNATGATISTATATGTIQNDDGVVLPSLAIAATTATGPEGNSGTTAFTFTVTRSGDSTGVSSANFAVTGSGANPANAADFVGGILPTGAVNFGAGQTSQLITINVVGDTLVESDENFTVTLSNATGATITTATANGTIQNDDAVVLPTLAIAGTTATLPEGNSGPTLFTFTVTRSGDTTAASSANFAVAGSGANPANAADFTGGVLPTGSVNFTAGQTSQVITISVAGDTLVEPTETFTVTLSSPTGATISTATATGTIQNDDAVVLPTLAIAATNATQAEGNLGTTAFTFTVIRSGDTTAASSASFAVAGSGANPANAADFVGGVLPTGTVNFAAGVTSQVITVNVAGDTTVEPNETFTVTLSSPTGATISTATATGTIQNDDGAILPTLGIAATNATQLEGDSGTTAFTFTVTRSGDTTAASSATFAVTGSGVNAANAADFSGGVLPTGTVNFAAGVTSQIVTVNVSGDTLIEADEGFTVTLSNATGSTITTATATGTIVNDDEPTEPGGEIIVETGNVPGDPGTAELVDDVDNPGEGAIIVTGTSGKDVIVILRVRDQIRVLRNGRIIGTFDSADVQNVVVFGLEGNDTIVVHAALTLDATLFGDAGNDTIISARGNDGLDGGAGNDKLLGGFGNDIIVGGDGNDSLHGQAGDDMLSGEAGNDKLFGDAGHDILLGGLGNDFLFGGAGRDLLIGGEGRDTLHGLGDDDILIGGSTVFDADQELLLALLAELRTGSYATRVANLRIGAGESGLALDESSLIDDGAADTLFGQGGSDWFLLGPGDRARDRSRTELVN